jgi:hypothetical protein
MKLEVNKFYKTRDGHKVHLLGCRSDTCGHRYPWLGYVVDSTDWTGGSWTAIGEYRVGCQDQQDLVAPWIDPPQAKPTIDSFDWSQLPGWANAGIAMDEDGEWFAWSTRPEITPVDLWATPGGSYALLPRILWPVYSSHWQDSWTPNPTLAAPVKPAEITVEADYDWSRLPAWAVCIYRQPDERWHWAQLSPTRNATGWYWSHTEQFIYQGLLPVAYDPKADIPWEKSLTMRPKTSDDVEVLLLTDQIDRKWWANVLAGRIIAGGLRS